MIQSLSLVGKKKTGKTTIALSAPKPLVIFDFEMGVKRVEPRFLKEMEQVTVHAMTPTSPLERKSNPQLAIDFWNKILTEYSKALESSAKTIVFDTFTAVWEARRLAFLGEIRKNEPARKNLMPQEYFVPNADMKQLLIQAQIHNKILVVTHHTREKYTEEGKPSGQEEPDGFKYTGDLVELEVWMSKKQGKPIATIETCGLAMSAEGLVLESPTYDLLNTTIEGYRSMS